MELEEKVLEQLKGMKIGSHIEIKIPLGGMIQFLDEIYFAYKLKMRYQDPYMRNTAVFQKTENIYGNYVGFDAVGKESYLPH